MEEDWNFSPLTVGGSLSRKISVDCLQNKLFGFSLFFDFHTHFARQLLFTLRSSLFYELIWKEIWGVLVRVMRLQMKVSGASEVDLDEMKILLSSSRVVREKKSIGWCAIVKIFVSFKSFSCAFSSPHLEVWQSNEEFHPKHWINETKKTRRCSGYDVPWNFKAFSLNQQASINLIFFRWKLIFKINLYRK